MKNNTQTPVGREVTDGTELRVHSIFYTIQGEGPYSGVPAVFIRLAGCNLQCPGCDTEYTQGGRSANVEAIYQEVLNLFPKDHKLPRLVVITGGEPLRQNINILLVYLLEGRAMVQIETNGTYAPIEGFPKGVKVVCSPKAPKVAPGLVPFISAYKYVLDAHDVSTSDGLPSSILGKKGGPARPHAGFQGPIYVSPMDVQDKELNGLNMHTTAAVCMRYGYILNLQVHKIVNLP